MEYEKTLRLEIRTSSDAEKVAKLKDSGWVEVDHGYVDDVDNREPRRAFFLLGLPKT